MAHFVVDRAAMAAIPGEPSVDRQIRALAGDILADAQGKAPVRTGALRSSGFADGDDSEYTIGFEVEYAPYVELGTSHMDAQPFLTPAALRDRGQL